MDHLCEDWFRACRVEMPREGALLGLGLSVGMTTGAGWGGGVSGEPSTLRDSLKSVQ